MSCWLGGRKGIRPVKSSVKRARMYVCMYEHCMQPVVSVVVWSVCLLVVSPAKTAELIKMLFAVWNWGGRGNFWWSAPDLPAVDILNLVH